MTERLRISEDRVELWAFVGSGMPVRVRGKGGRFETADDGSASYVQDPRKGRPAFSARVEIRRFRRINLLVVRGDRIVPACEHHPL